MQAQCNIFVLTFLGSHKTLDRIWNYVDLARTQQKGGGDLVHQSIFDIPCIPL